MMKPGHLVKLSVSGYKNYQTYTKIDDVYHLTQRPDGWLVTNKDVMVIVATAKVPFEEGGTVEQWFWVLISNKGMGWVHGNVVCWVKGDR